MKICEPGCRCRRHKRYPSPLLRLERQHRVTETGCWEWTGFINLGYGRIRIGNAVKQVHRVAYELFVGPVPRDLFLDHLCRNRACFNPAHLEPVTHRENSIRGEGVAGVNVRKTHCPKGHPYDYLPEKGGRRCRTCKNEQQRQRRALKAAT